MVAMQVAQQNMPNLADRYPVAAQPNLHALSAIDQEEVSPEIDHLSRGRVSQRRFRTTTPQYGHLKTVQII